MRMLPYSVLPNNVGIYPLKEGRHEDVCPSVDLLSKGTWCGTASVKDRHAGRLVKGRAEQTTFFQRVDTYSTVIPRAIFWIAVRPYYVVIPIFILPT
jgi:hypothetical protein